VDNGRLAYTIKELATAAGICRDNVYDAIRADQLRAKKFGKRTLVLKVDAPGPQVAAERAKQGGAPPECRSSTPLRAGSGGRAPREVGEF
jgi:hypothetical protein